MKICVISGTEEHRSLLRLWYFQLSCEAYAAYIIIRHQKLTIQKLNTKPSPHVGISVKVTSSTQNLPEAIPVEHDIANNNVPVSAVRTATALG